MSTDKLGRVCVILTAVIATCGAIGADSSTTPKPVLAQLASRPLSFEPNRGQTDRQVEFLAHGAGYGLFLSHGEAVMVLGRSATVRMRPAGANLSAAPEGLDQQPNKSNYFIGSLPERWHTDIANYAKVRYRNVYPGVDLIYYGNQRQLEYDFVVRPGADGDAISLEFEGETGAQLNRKGEIVLHTAAGDLRSHKPVAYQYVNGRKRVVGCNYARRGQRQLRFRVADYDRSKALIIDPVLDYSTYLGGSGFDSGASIAVDKRGNAYVTGRVTSADFPTKNAFQNSLKTPNGNVFVTKFDTAGRLVYSTYLGGSGSNGLGDEVTAIAVDNHGNAYVTGYTTSLDFPTKNPIQATGTGGQAFVTKFDRDGDALIYSTYLGGSGFVIGTSIGVDARERART